MYGLAGVTVTFGDTVALRHVDLLATPGHVVAVVGGNGAGKSTLLRTLVGLVRPDTGRVTAPDPAAVGYLPARAGSWLELTVGENFDFVGSIFGLRGQDLSERSGELTDAANLTAARDRLSGQLSGGMRRKLGFSLAMIHQPPLLVLDEPSTGVDPVSRVELWRLISQAAADGAAVVMSTTYLDEAERSTTLLVLDQGQVVVAGPPSEVVANFAGVITAADAPVRRQWAWRRGRVFHELWPAIADGNERELPASAGVPLAPDLEDVVIAVSLQRRLAAGPGASGDQ